MMMYQEKNNKIYETLTKMTISLFPENSHVVDISLINFFALLV